MIVDKNNELGHDDDFGFWISDFGFDATNNAHPFSGDAQQSPMPKHVLNKKPLDRRTLRRDILY